MGFFDNVKKVFKSSDNNLGNVNENNEEINVDLEDSGANNKKFEDEAIHEESDDNQLEPSLNHNFTGPIADDEYTKSESLENNNVLFLCATNTMISPIAEAVFNNKIGINNAFSAGLFAPDGGKVSSTAINLCKRHGIDLSKRDVTHINEISIEDMDLIITFNEYHRDKLKEEYPDLNIFTYIEYAGYLSSSKSGSVDYYDDEDDFGEVDLNIPDYFDGNFSSFEYCFDEFVSELKRKDKFGDELSSNEKFLNFNFLNNYIQGVSDEFIMDCDAINVNQYDVTIKIDRDDITIDGRGHVIDALGKDRIFIISANNITLKNITFKNGFSTINGYYRADGGAINIIEGSVTIENCIFINNHSLNGGAINCGDSERVFIKKCKFIDNSSTGFGGAIRGAYSSDDKLIVEDCQFISNRSNIGGASHNGLYEGCDFLKNSAVKYGGAASGGLFVKCNFNDNFAGQSGGACDGSSAEECEFIGNSSYDYGGASSGGDYKLCIFKGNSSNYGGAFSEGGLLEDCKFIDNMAKIKGHAIYSEDNLKIEGSCFEDSFSDECNGNSDIENDNLFSIICYKGNDNWNLNIKNSVFHSGLSKIINIEQGYSYFYGLKIKNNNKFVVFNQNGTVEIHKPKFNSSNMIYNNHALYINSSEFKEISIEEGPDSKIFYLDEGVSHSLNGFTYLERIIEKEAPMVNLNEDILLSEIEQRFFEGGIELDYDYLEIDGNNHVIDANGLSRIFIITGKKIILKNIVFKNGKDFYDEFSKSSGGAIYTFKSTDLTIINCKFINNISKNSIGAIASRGNSLKIKNTLFLDNHAEGDSVGAVYNENGSFEIGGCEFRDNSSRGYAGAIHNKNGDLTCINSNFIGNESKTHFAGAIRIDSGNSLFKECSFINNKCKNEGGAIYNRSDLVIEECRFENNVSSTSFGGAVNSRLLDISESKFIENSSEYGGGAIYTDDLAMVNCIFERNMSDRGSGAIYVSSDHVELSNSSFIGNHSGSSGGAIDCAARSKLKLNNILFDGNNSVYSAGAIKSNGLHINCCRFINNHSKGNAGAISNSGETCISDCQFINNSSDKKGGALELTGYSISKLDKCEFTGNDATVDGVVYAWDNEAEFVDCNFENNSCIVHSRNNDVKFVKCNFENNSVFNEKQIIEEIKNIDDSGIRSILSNRIHDEETLIDLIFNDPSESVCSVALNNISNEAIINEIALKDSRKNIRIEAINRVVDKAVLEYINKNDRDFEIHVSAQKRLQKLGY